MFSKGQLSVLCQGFTGIKKSLAPGKYYDTFGLILRVSPRGVMYWFWRGMLFGRRVDRGIGTYPSVSVAEARSIAERYRKMAKEGKDPRNWKGTVPTVEKAGKAFMKTKRSTWDDKTEAEWLSTMRTYIRPLIGKMPVDVVTAVDARRCAEPIWDTKSVTANRVLQRINAIMLWSVGAGSRESWPAHFPKAARFYLGDNRKPVKHHPAIHHSEMAEVIKRIRRSKIPPSAKLLMEFVIQNSSRSKEGCGLTWDEIDLKKMQWLLPKERSKNREPNTRPIVEATMWILDQAAELADGSNLVFPRPNGGQYSSDAISKYYERIVRDMDQESRFHGARSTFQDYSDEKGIHRYITRACLGHKQQGTLSHYARSTLQDLRREHMEAWTNHIEPS